MRAMDSFDATAPPSQEGPLSTELPDRPELEPSQLPDRLGRYHVLGSLGQGAMGVVAAAYDPELDRKVAIKLLKAGARDPVRARERLRREAQALAKLSHPNVVGVHDVGIHDGQVYIAMEFVEGQTLREWIDARMLLGMERSERSWDKVLALFEAAGRGLAAAHAAELIHRDFKPDNVMIGQDGRVRVMDFGLASLHDEEQLESIPDEQALASGSFSDIRLTATGAGIGTPAYMSPEQWAEGGEVTARSDQFAFCVALFEAIRGQRPFKGDSLGRLRRSVTRGEIEQPLGRLDAPLWLREVLARGMKSDPGQRFASMDELLAALERGRGRGRRMVALAGALGLGALLAAGLGYRAWERDQREAACARAGESIDEVWNASVAERLRGGLEHSGVAHGATAAERITPWLDARAEAWRARRVELCGHESLTRDWDASTVAKAEWCLSQNRRQLKTLVGMLSEADDKTLITMLPVAAQPGTIADCLDEGALLLQPDAPAQELQEPIGRAYAELWGIEHLQTLGQLDAARAQVEQARERAQELDWAPLLSKTQLIEADVLGDAGEYELAVELARRSYMEAAAADRWASAFSAALGLAKLEGERRGEFDAATLWLEHAEVARGHAGDPHGQREASLLVVLGAVQFRTGEFEAAKDSLNRALELREGSLGADHPDISWALNNLGGLYGSTGDPARGLELLQRALEITKRNYGEEHPRVATKLRNIGMMKIELEDFAGARETLEQAIARDSEQLGARHPNVATGRSNLAKALIALGELDAAQRELEQALEIREQALGPEHPKLADSYATQCSLLERRAQREQARASCTRALEIREVALSPDHPKVAESRAQLEALGPAEPPAAEDPP